MPAIPGMSSIPSLTGGAGGAAQSGSSSYAGVSNPTSTPFNFDGSGWNVNIGGTGDQSATGNSDANAGASAGSSVTSKNWMLYAAGAVVIWLIARRS